MSANGTIPAIDADGHFLERKHDIAEYLEAPFQGRLEIWPGDQPWAAEVELREPPPYDYVEGLSPVEQKAIWHRVLADHELEAAALFSTNGAGAVAAIQHPEFAVAAARACNSHFAADYMDDRLKPIGVLPMGDPKAAAEEVKRATELGLVGFEVMPIGLPYALGDPFYDPVYAMAERHGAAICVHGTRMASHEFGADKLRNFSEVHCYAFTAGLLMHFTSIIGQGVPVRFPELKLAILEIGCTWLPYYLDRLDEHYDKRGHIDMVHLAKAPSEVFRESNIKVSLEGKETLLAETVDFVGAGHLVYATDVPHWDAEFPENLKDIRAAENLSRDVKEQILYHNAKALFSM